MYAQLSYNSAKKADVVSGPISKEVADKLKTIDDFIDNNIIARRGYKAGNYNNNAYLQVSLYAPDYAGIQSNNSISGGITFRKTAFELLAAKGWKDGFISYISDKYAIDAKKAGKSLSDSFILEKIFNGEYDNDYATFKKAMFKERIDKLNDFKPLTITLNKKNIKLNSWDDLQKLMQNTVDQELALRSKGKGSNLINNLKAAILAAEFKQTDDFRDSIFKSEVVKQGKIIGDGTITDLPKYDTDSLKKGESIYDGTTYDLKPFDLNTLKKGESVGDSTSYDLSTLDLSKKNSNKNNFQKETELENADYNLPELVLSIKQNDNDQDNNQITDQKLDDSGNKADLTNEKVSSKDTHKIISDNVNPKSISKKKTSKLVSKETNSINPKTVSLNMAPVKSNEIKMNTDTQRLMLPNGTNRSLTKSNESLPQTGNKTTWASFSLTIIGGLISMLGLVGIKKKNK